MYIQFGIIKFKYYSYSQTFLEFVAGFDYLFSVNYVAYVCVLYNENIS